MASWIPTIAVFLLSRWVFLPHLSVVHSYTWTGHGSASGVLRDSCGANESKNHLDVSTDGVGQWEMRRERMLSTLRRNNFFV